MFQQQSKDYLSKIDPKQLIRFLQEFRKVSLWHPIMSFHPNRTRWLWLIWGWSLFIYQTFSELQRYQKTSFIQEKNWVEHEVKTQNDFLLRSWNMKTMLGLFWRGVRGQIFLTWLMWWGRERESTIKREKKRKWRNWWREDRSRNILLEGKTCSFRTGEHVFMSNTFPPSHFYFMSLCAV